MPDFLKNVFNDNYLIFFFFVNVSSVADPPQAKLSIGCLFAYPGQRKRFVASSTHVKLSDASKSLLGCIRYIYDVDLTASFSDFAYIDNAR